MDNLILSLTPEQHKKYIEIKNEKAPLLNFDVPSIQIEYCSIDTRGAKNMIANACEKLLVFSKHDSFFEKSLSSKEINALIPVYYEGINSIDVARKELYKAATELSRKIVKIDAALSTLYSDYSEFLPYKAALFDREEYKNEILTLDDRFLSEISRLSEEKSRSTTSLESISNMTDILIPEFFSSLTKVSDAPRFKDFKHRDFFAVVNSFTEKIKTI